MRHIIYTAETHNFPTGNKGFSPGLKNFRPSLRWFSGVSPFPGAATGTGGRIRDVQAAGRGGYVVAAVAGYSFGNLNIAGRRFNFRRVLFIFWTRFIRFSGYNQPWEHSDWCYPTNFARPLDICIQASNGASDYGNKFGEPVICGFARSFGQSIQYDGDAQERVEYVKPIMFSGGVGTIDDSMLKKCPPKKGLDRFSLL